MIDRPPAIVVTLPARSVAEARSEIALARKAGGDLAEIRLDRWPAAELERVEALFPSELPLLATYRSAAEGGAGESEPKARREILLRVARLPFRWIDLEFERDRDLERELPPVEGLGRILSSHLREGSTAVWGRRLHELAQGDAVGKFVVPCSVRSLFRDLLPALPPPEEGSLVVHTTGPSGPLLRALARRRHFPFVYAALPAGASGAPVEPSQVPVDRLRPFLEGGPTAPLFAVVGRPIAHSLSPELHGRWMREMRRVGLYLALELQDEREFVEGLTDLASIGVRGINVTHPFKAAALEASTETTPGAARCGAVNCLTLREGRIEGENTDLLAVLRRLGELRNEGRWDGRSLTVVGAGGAARATLAAASTVGAHATVIARRSEAAAAVAKEFGAELGDPLGPQPSALLVHATPAGRKGSDPLAFPIGPLLAPGGVLLDWVYRPDEPILKEAALRAGSAYEDGWRLFVYQAAASFEVWWDEGPEAQFVEAALEEGGCAA